MARFEHLMERRPLLLNSVLLRQNPHNVAEWQKRVALLEGTAGRAACWIAMKEGTVKKWVFFKRLLSFPQVNRTKSSPHTRRPSRPWIPNCPLANFTPSGSTSPSFTRRTDSWTMPGNRQLGENKNCGNKVIKKIFV